MHRHLPFGASLLWVGQIVQGSTIEQWQQRLTEGGAMARQGDHPSNDVYTLKQVLQEHNTTYEIVLCRSQLKQARVLSTCSMACNAYQTTHDGLVVSVSVVCFVIFKKLVACWAWGSAKLKHGCAKFSYAQQCPGVLNRCMLSECMAARACGARRSTTPCTSTRSPTT